MMGIVFACQSQSPEDYLQFHILPCVAQTLSFHDMPDFTIGQTICSGSLEEYILMIYNF